MFEHCNRQFRRNEFTIKNKPKLYQSFFVLLETFQFNVLTLYDKKRQNSKVLPIQYNKSNIDIVKTRILKLKEVE